MKKKTYCSVSDCKKEAKIWFKHKKSDRIDQFHYCIEHAEDVIEEGLFRNHIPINRLQKRILTEMLHNRRLV